jgi:GDP-4-dehydro-6-deoxy-D-mannose reductase
VTTLVTGAAGFVGGHLLELLSREDGDIVAWSRDDTQPRIDVPGVRWTSVEMQSPTEVTDAIEQAQPSQIYHLAGAAHAGDSWLHTHETFAGNVLATSHLLNGVLRLERPPRVLIAGSAAIYTPLNRALVERDPVRPTSPYGTSKLAQEMLAIHAFEQDRTPTIIARSFNHVGPRQSTAYVASRIAQQIVQIEAGRNDPVLTMGNLEAERDFMDVRDTVRAYRRMMQAATPGVPYNVCSGRAVAVRELVQMFLDRARVSVRLESDPGRLRPSDVPLLLGDHTRLTADTGWTPEISLEQTVDDLLAYWRTAI